MTASKVALLGSGIVDIENATFHSDPDDIQSLTSGLIYEPGDPTGGHEYTQRYVLVGNPICATPNQ